MNTHNTGETWPEDPLTRQLGAPAARHVVCLGHLRPQSIPLSVCLGSPAHPEGFMVILNFRRSPATNQQ